ncbi:GntR family transcriptional regulator [Actinospica durhamensis]|uniref:GntR family transcriptional regulator n=1 Tax=Actinospica durhamensis TaxID=1508375 RepID=A0A941EQF5_9ACTN|nr:GntR family transcriptional regulator [Actinospica durhamensis]MBR7836585.1 GntR family transcriptional regulator [Actinospica durhamensis]
MPDAADAPRIPRYQQVKRELIAAIEAGRFSPDVPFVTQRSICEDFGVSHATAVRALSDLVAEGHVVRRRGQGTFVAPRASDRPAAGDGSIACIVQHHGPHVGNLLAGVESACAELGYRLYLSHCENDPDREEQALRAALDHGASGIVAYPGHSASLASVYLEAGRRGIPLVLVDRYLPEIEADAVVADNYGAGLTLTEELIAGGHRVIATLWDEIDATSVRDRLAGHLEALRRHDIPARADLTVLTSYHELTPEQRRTRLLDLLRAPQPPSVLLCANGYVLAGAAQDLVDLGFDIPGDVDLAGMDDAGPFDVLPLTVAAVSLPSREMGEQAMRLLHRRIRAGRPSAPERIVLPVTVNARRFSRAHLRVVATKE